MNITRQELDDLLVDYLYDELSMADRARFEEGVGAHPDLQAEVAAHQRTMARFADLPEEPLPVGIVDGVMREARLAVAVPVAEPTVPWLDRLMALFMQPAFATAMAAVLAVGVWFAMQGGVVQPEHGAHTNGPVAKLTKPAAEAERAPTTAPAVAMAQPTPKEAAPSPPAAPAPVDLAQWEAPAAGEPQLDAAAGAATIDGASQLKQVADGTVVKLVEAAAPETARDEPAPQQVASARRSPRARVAGKSKAKRSNRVTMKPATAASGGYAKGAFGAGGGKDSSAGSLGDVAMANGALDDDGEGHAAGADEAAETEQQVIAAAEKPGPAPAAKPAAAAPKAPPTPAQAAAALLKKADAHVAAGRDDLAQKALDELAKIPGYEKKARSYSKELASRRATERAGDRKAGAATKKAGAPAKKYSAPRKKASSTKGDRAFR